MDRGELQVGQMVWVHDVNSRCGPYQCAVTRVGRALLEVAFRDWPGRAMTFRIDSQRANGELGSWWWFRTDEQEAAANRQHEWQRILRENGVDLRRQLHDDVLRRLAEVFVTEDAPCR